jgi:nucleotide sugar dehydrogenase
MSEVLSQLETTDATIGVVGLGYVGLPLATAFAGEGFDVVGLDIDDHRIARLQSGESYVDDVSDETLAAAVEDRFEPTTDPDRLDDCDATLFAVPTGVDDGQPNMSALSDAVETATARLRDDEEHLFIVSSTVYPGAVDDVVAPAIERARPGETAIHVAVVPERLNPGGTYGLSDIPVVVGGDTETAREGASELLGRITGGTRVVSSTEVATMSKLIENTYRLVNISMINELATVADEMGVDIWEAVEAADTKPFGFQAFHPGVGAGGHCTPVDPQFLSWRANEAGRSLQMVESAAEVNRQMPSHIAARVRNTLRDDNIAPVDADVLVVGLTYKPNVADFRNSAAIDACDRLADTCGSVSAYEPVGEDAPVSDRVTVLDEEPDYGNADLVALFVAHDVVDTDDMRAQSTRLFDATGSIKTDGDSVVGLSSGRFGDGV